MFYTILHYQKWDVLLFNKDTTFNLSDFPLWFKHHALAPNGIFFIIMCWFYSKLKMIRSSIVIIGGIKSVSTTFILFILVCYILFSRKIFTSLVDKKPALLFQIVSSQSMWFWRSFEEQQWRLVIELYFILHGLRLDYKDYHMNIILEFDSMVAIDIIMSDA